MFVWYAAFVAIVIVFAFAAVTGIFYYFLNVFDSPASVLLISQAIVFPALIIALAGGIYIIVNRRLDPVQTLKKFTEKAERYPLSKDFPDIQLNENSDSAATVSSIYEFMKRRHEKVQRVLHFSSLASHELRTPLSIIRNQLEDGLQADITLDRLNEIVASTYDEIIWLHHLLNDLLTISTLQAGTMRIEKSEVNFHSFIKEIYDEVLLLSREKNISVVLARGPQITLPCDPGRLRQVVFNLIENALKNTPEKGKIRITYRSVNNSLECKISDTGCGISDDQIDKIFEPFYQAPKDGDQVRQGAGLGLTLVQWIIEAHNGAIQVESEEGKGTTFTIYLPLFTHSSSTLK